MSLLFFSQQIWDCWRGCEGSFIGRIRQINTQEIHKNILYGAHRSTPWYLCYSPWGSWETLTEWSRKWPSMPVFSIQNLLCCSRGKSSEFGAGHMTVLTQWDMSCILKYIFFSFPACPLVVKDGNNFAGTIFLCSFLFLTCGTISITLFSQY